MKIVRVDAAMITCPLTTPYVIAYESVSDVVNILIQVVTDTGIVGVGVAAPDFHVTGETASEALRAVEEIGAPLLVGRDPLRPAQIADRLKKKLKPWPSVRSGIGIALCDVMGKKAGVPAFKLLGGFRDRMMTSITVGILDEIDTVKACLEHVRAGFKALKLKGGKDVDLDVVRILKVREAVGEGIFIRFDANQGYLPEEAVRFVAGTRSAKVEVLEQPTPKNDLEMLGTVTRRVSVPVMADEVLLSVKDAFRLAKRGLADMVNIKLMKVGGIQEAFAVNAVARAAGLEAMVGCMDELALGIAAGLGVALGSPNIVFADLDGHIGLEGDPTCQSVTLKNGVLFPNPAPGFGIEGML